MKTPKPGHIPARYLALLDDAAPRIHAEKNTAAAYSRLRKAHPAAHIVGRAAGYWSAAFDLLVHIAPGRYGIAPSEAKILAPRGQSEHLRGTRINIHGITEAQAAAYGFRAFNSFTFDYTGKLSWD